ncbi:MAG: glycosyltransferase [Candidatus Roizmanbacteria bacterium]|nr:glycosyltransferase [Candidatus Roizmanbacteria bacterium]
MNGIIRIDGGALSSPYHLGTYTVTREILQALGQYDHINRYVVYTQKKASKLPPHYPHLSYQSLPFTRGWNTIGIPLQELLAYWRKGGLYLALNHAVPPYTAAPVISLCHGLSFHAHPDAYPQSHGSKRLEALTRAMIARSSHILVSSIKVSQELQDWYGVPSSHISSIPFGIPHGFTPSKRYKPKKILLWVGSLHPIKQLDLALSSFSLLRQKKEYRQYKLVLIGVPQQTRLPDSVMALGHVGDKDDLHKMYCEAAALLVTSRYESFHFPTLESLACGTPVVSVQSACIPELAPYVTTVDTDPEALAYQLAQVIRHLPVVDYQTLKKQFSWKSYSSALMRLYRTYGDTVAS